jgi:hypothetical protein
VTDAPPPPHLAQAFKRAKIQVVIAGPAPVPGMTRA